MLKDTLLNTIYDVWPMLIISIIILSAIRIAHLIGNREKIILWKELLALLFLIYILILFYVVTNQDTSQLGTSNYIPFKEILRYDFGSNLFFKNIIGNVLLFVPFGLFASYYINNRKIIPIFILTAISSVSIEFVQSKIGRVFDVDDVILNIIGGVFGYILYIIFVTISSHLPRIFHTNIFKNIIVLLFIALIIIYLFSIDTSIFKRLL